MQITFNNTVTAESDVHRHIPHVFEIPLGTTQIQMKFEYTPRYSENQPYHNQLCLSLFDPNGARGVYYLIREWGITLNEVKNSQGFNSGPLQSGIWTVFVDTYRLMPPDEISYQITITLSSDPIEGVSTDFAPKKKLQRGQGWYRGDLHAHSYHSDASWDIPDLVNHAREQGLDFVTLTDHNTISGLAQHDSLTDDDLLTMGGMELTTYYGHALALGIREWHEWRLDTDEKPSMSELAQRVIDSGAFFVIAHPMTPGDPYCSGCRWEFEDMRPGCSPAVEVWNGGWRESNEMSLAECYKWLNDGHRLVLTAGSDNHGEQTDVDSRIGRNVVYSEELSEVAILDAIRQGHSYLSAGPELLLTGHSDSGIDAMAGDMLPAVATTLRVRWSGTHTDDVIRLIGDGELINTQVLSGNEIEWTLDAGQFRWCTVELRGTDGMMWAITNPIFFENTD